MYLRFETLRKKEFLNAHFFLCLFWFIDYLLYVYCKWQICLNLIGSLILDIQPILDKRNLSTQGLDFT